MVRNFREVEKFLEANYPDLRGRIRGENYPVPPAAQYAGMALQFVQLALLACVFLGDSVWNFIPGFRGQPPGWYYGLKENKMAVVVAVFLVVPTLVQNMTQSGAFEIVMDDGVVLFSKLASGRMPNGNDIIEALAKVGMTMATAEQ